jgi:glycosyltransferase involved in cell wall biosynthesis
VRVLLDARKVRDGGIGTYLRTLISGIKTFVPSVHLTCLVRDSEQELVASMGSDTTLFKGGLYSIRELTEMRRLASPERFDLFHTPHYPLGFGISVPVVVTIHDVFHLSHPQRWWYPFYAFPILLHSLTKASTVIAVSQATHGELIKRFNGDISKKMVVIPNALPLNQSTIVDRSSTGIHSPFFSVFSNTKPHKGLLRLFDAYSQYRRSSSRSPRRLVVAGFGTTCLSSIALPEGVTNEGVLSQSELMSRYDSAYAVVVPSTCEGFCLSVLEAHSRGCPVISTPIPAVRELLTTQDISSDSFLSSSLAASLLESETRLPQQWSGDLSPYALSTVIRSTIEAYQRAVAHSLQGVL